MNVRATQRRANDDAYYAPFLYLDRPAEKDGRAIHESDHLREVMETAPSGAMIVCGLAVAMLVGLWLAAVLLVLARGPVG